MKCFEEGIMIKYNLDSASNFRIFGFATGTYSCKCSECGTEFTGDKRAGQCLECAIKQAQKTAHNSDYMKKPSALEYSRICTKEGIDPFTAGLIYSLFFI